MAHPARADVVLMTPEKFVMYPLDNVKAELPRPARVPDASFVRADQLPQERIGAGLFTFAPAIAIEVLSPSETASELQEKLDDYRVSATALVCVVDPVRRTVMVVAREEPLKVLCEEEQLSGGEVLLEFSCAVKGMYLQVARDWAE